MTKFHVLTGIAHPRLWLWRDQTSQSSSQLAYPLESQGNDSHGLTVFETKLDHQLHERAHFKVFSDAGWEKDAHKKTVPGMAFYRFPAHCWCAEGASRVLVNDPFGVSCSNVRIHLITAKKYRSGRLLIWGPEQENLFLDAVGEDQAGPFFDIAVEGRNRNLFLFKFITAEGVFEPEYANRLWHGHDGGEIWVHSQSASISINCPERKKVTIHVGDFPQSAIAPNLHVWQDDSDFAETLPATEVRSGFYTFEPQLYTDREYGCMLHQPAFEQPWEHTEARRFLTLKKDGVWTTGGDGEEKRISKSSVYTLKGDHHLFGKKPVANCNIEMTAAESDPRCAQTTC